LALPKQTVDLASAISVAEGFPVLNSAPNRAHNPGSLKLKGYPTTGTEGISVFESDDDGWTHLYDEIELIRTDKSHVYNTDMTFDDFAMEYTDTQHSIWLNNVLSKLKSFGYNVDEQTTLDEFFNG